MEGAEHYPPQPPFILISGSEVDKSTGLPGFSRWTTSNLDKIGYGNEQRN